MYNESLCLDYATEKGMHIHEGHIIHLPLNFMLFDSK